MIDNLLNEAGFEAMHRKFFEHIKIPAQKTQIDIAFGMGVFQAMVVIKTLNEAVGEEITMQFVEGLREQSKQFVDQIVKKQ